MSSTLVQPTPLHKTPQYRQRRWLGLPDQQSQIGDQLIVGCGMGGSWIAKALRQTLPNLRIHGIDPDTVDTENLGAQAFGLDHLTMGKVEALPLTAGVNGKFPQNMPEHWTDYHTVWSLSDSLNVRKEVAEWALDRARYIVDIRAHWPTFEWYIIDTHNPEAYKKYMRTAHKFTDAQVPDEAACSKVGTIAHAWANCGIPLHHWGLAASSQTYLPFGELNLTTMEVCY